MERKDIQIAPVGRPIDSDRKSGEAVMGHVQHVHGVNVTWSETEEQSQGFNEQGVVDNKQPGLAKTIESS